MKELIKKLWEKYKGIFFYGVFGVITTIVNIYTYILCYETFGIANIPSNIIAWIAGVAVAFITNKLWVFDSKSFEPKVVWAELTKFVSCRLVTGGIDMVIMFVGVDVMNGPAKIIKVASNVLVIILNYVFSKLIIFRKKEEKQ